MRKSRGVERAPELGIGQAFRGYEVKIDVSSVSKDKSRGRLGLEKPADLEVEETLLHLALFRHQAFIICRRRRAKLNMKGRIQRKKFFWR